MAERLLHDWLLDRLVCGHVNALSCKQVLLSRVCFLPEARLYPLAVLQASAAVRRLIPCVMCGMPS
jgi:hypothetical protein